MNWAKRFRPTICETLAKSGDWLMIIGDALVGRPRKLTPAFYWVMAHRFLTLKGGKKMYSYAEYERKKADWVQANPEATPQEYQAAMRRIALECGV